MLTSRDLSKGWGELKRSARHEVCCSGPPNERRIKHGGGQNDATGVYDPITWNFIKYVWNYRKTMGPRVRALIEEHAGHAEIRILRSRRAANRFLAQATTRQSSAST